MMNRLIARARFDRGDDRGNLMLVFLILVISTGLTAVALGTVFGATSSTRHDNKFTAALPPADSGVQQALYSFNKQGPSPTGIPAPPTSCSNPAPTASSPQWGAVQDATKPLVWHVTAYGCNGGIVRKVTADLVQSPRFQVGAFADAGAGVHGASSSITSYGANNHLGTIGSNGSVVFHGNTDVSKIILFDYAGTNANAGRCSGTPCAYTDANNTGSDPAFNGTIVYTVSDPYPVTQADLPAGSDDPNQFMTDQLNACEAANGTLQPWVASENNYTLVNTGQPQCYSSMTFDGPTTVSGASSANPLQLYVSGNIAMTMNGNASNKIVNVPNNTLPIVTSNNYPDSAALQIYSTGTSVAFVNNSTFVGLIWAPFATCAGATSSATSDIYGSMICGTIDNQGDWNFHWDESLANKVGLGSWHIANYSEQ
jgi:hypothetical protein